MEAQLVAGRSFGVVQKKEWGEVLLDFETRNRYALVAEDGSELGSAAEEGGVGRMLVRSFLQSSRPATIHVLDAGGREVARGLKPFRIWFYSMDVEWEGKKLGSLRRRFSILSRKFTVSDAYGRDVLTILSPWLRIWTFKVLQDGREIARIRKRWGGALKELFTEADSFGLEFEDPGLDPELKKLLLVGTFLIDLTCFEKRGN